MESSSQCALSRGLWSRPTAQASSKESRDMLQLMKQESRLTNFQRKQTKPSSKNRTDTSVRSPPASKSVHTQRLYISRRRSAESCRSGDSYTREAFRPSPGRDLEKEKRRLQDILSMETEKPTAASLEESLLEEKERFEEILDEIEERRQFLADMASLGQEREYIDIISAEISQKMRELELLEKDAVRAEDRK